MKLTTEPKIFHSRLMCLCQFWLVSRFGGPKAFLQLEQGNFDRVTNFSPSQTQKERKKSSFQLREQLFPSSLFKRCSHVRVHVFVSVPSPLLCPCKKFPNCLIDCLKQSRARSFTAHLPLQN